MLPLWGRATESRKQNPLLKDYKAVAILEKIHYDFSVIGRNVSKISQAVWIARSIYFDTSIKEFLKLYPEALMDKSAYMKWGTDDIDEVEKWEGGIRILDNRLMFEDNMKKFPLFKTIGMKISDMMKIMSLAHARID